MVIDEVKRAIEDDWLPIMRHSAAHVMAEAVQSIFTDAKFGIGPAIENGFYYDFDLPRSLSPDDLSLIEARMREIIAANVPFAREEIAKQEARRLFASLAFRPLPGLLSPGPSLLLKLLHCRHHVSSLKPYQRGEHSHLTDAANSLDWNRQHPGSFLYLDLDISVHPGFEISVIVRDLCEHWKHGDILFDHRYRFDLEHAADEIVVVYDEYGPVRMIRTRQWKYVHRCPDGPHDLYDLINDPDERQNLAEEEGHANRIRELRATMEEWFDRYVDPDRDGLQETY